MTKVNQKMKKTKKEVYCRITKVGAFKLAHKENYERITMALCLAGYFVRIGNDNNGVGKVVEVYTYFYETP